MIYNYIYPNYSYHWCLNNLCQVLKEYSNMKGNDNIIMSFIKDLEGLTNDWKRDNV